MPLQPLDQQFLGFAQDSSRDQLSRGVMWRMADLIPNLGAPARKRGGWTYQGNALSGSYISGLGYFRKTTGATESLVAINDKGQVMVGGVLKGILSATQPVKHAPFYFLGNLVIPDANYSFKRWDGTSLGTGITGYNVGAPWGDFIVVANKSTDSTLLSWGTTVTAVTAGSNWNLPGEILAVAGLATRQILVFGRSDTWTLIGDTPPPGGNLVQRTLYAGNGIMDQRTLVNTGAYVIWANTNGIFQSSGSEAVPLDLTERGGLSLYWRSKVSGFSASAGWSASATHFKNFYIISVTDASRAPVVTLMHDLNSGRWTELTNIVTLAFAHAPGSSTSSEECYFGQAQEARIGKLSSLWTPGAAALALDGNGIAVLPSLETPYYRLSGFQEDRIRNILASYDLRSTVGNSFIKISYVLSPGDAAYIVSARTLPLTTKQDRNMADIRRRTRGIGLKLELSSTADDLSLFGLEAEAHTGFEKR